MQNNIDPKLYNSTSGSSLADNLFEGKEVIVSGSPVKQSLKLSQDIQKFLSLLNRNNNYQIITNKRTQECKYISGGIKYLPKDWDWIGFQPLPVKDKLEGNKRGGNQNVAALSCIFADFDGIDFGNYTDDGWLSISQDKREECKKLAVDKIKSLEIKPSAIIDSGGGYYCFWFIKNPIILNIDNRNTYNALSHDWSKFIGSDTGAADLAHVLGLPGSKNYKYSPPQEIKLIEFDEKLFYEIDDFVKLLPKREERKQKDDNYKGGYSLENDLFATTQLLRLSPSRADSYYGKDVVGNDHWLGVGMALYELGDIGLEKWIEWSKKSDKFNEKVEDEMRRSKWPSFGNARDERITLASLKYWADEDNPIISKFKIGTMEDAYEFIEPITYTVDKLVETETYNVYYGSYGCKKTYALIDMAVCIANGKNWCGLQTIQSPVIWVDEESGNKGLKRRMKRANMGEGGNKDCPFYFFSKAGFNFYKNTKEHMDILKEFILEKKAKVVFFDAFKDIMRGGDENATKDTEVVSSALDDLAKELNITIIAIHHANARGGIKGNTAIPQTADVTIKVESTEGKNSISFISEKMRNAEPLKIYTEIHFDGIDGPYYMEEAESPFDNKKPNESEQVVINYLKENGSMVREKFLDTAPDEKTRTKWENAINRLLRDEVIDHLGEVKRNQTQLKLSGS